MKILYALIPLLLCLCLAACNGSQPQTTSPAADATLPSSTGTTAPSGTTAPAPTDTTAHQHQYTSQVTEASCTEDGATVFTCPCGESYTEAIPATGHDYADETVAPTCTAEGYTVHTCATCGDSYTDSTTAMVDHSYEETVIAPTCTEDGYTQHTCATCGDSYTDQATPAGHNYVSAVIRASYTAGGCTQHTCSGCGDSYQTDFTNKLYDVDSDVYADIAASLSIDLMGQDNSSGFNFETGGRYANGEMAPCRFKILYMITEIANAPCDIQAVEIVLYTANGLECTLLQTADPNHAKVIDEHFGGFGCPFVDVGNWDDAQLLSYFIVSSPEGLQGQISDSGYSVEQEVYLKIYLADGGVAHLRFVDSVIGFGAGLAMVEEEPFEGHALQDNTPADHTHSYTANVIAPFNGYRGYTIFICQCGHSYIGDFVAAELTGTALPCEPMALRKRGCKQ